MISRPLGLIPPGLLGLFQLKNNGQNPVDLPDVLQPVLEMRDWYMQSRSVDWVTARGSGTFPGVTLATGADGLQRLAAGAVGLTVPSNEWWYVWHFNLTAALVAGDTLGANPAMAVGPVAGPTSLYNVGNQSYAASITGADRTFSAPAMAPFWAPPGAELVALVHQITAAVTIGIVGHVRFTPLPV